MQPMKKGQIKYHVYYDTLPVDDATGKCTVGPDDGSFLIVTGCVVLGTYKPKSGTYLHLANTTSEPLSVSAGAGESEAGIAVIAPGQIATLVYLADRWLTSASNDPIGPQVWDVVRDYYKK